MMGKIELLVEKYARGSQRIKLFSKSYNEAYGESLEIIYDTFGYKSDEIDIEVKGRGGPIDFYDRDKTILARMRIESDKYILYTIAG